MFLFYRNDPYGQGVPILPQEDQSQNQNQNYQAPNILNPAAEGMDEIMRAAANLENSILHRHNPQRQLLWSPYQTQDGRLFLSGETVNYYHTLYSSQYQHYRGGYGGPRDPRDFENTNFIRPLPVYPRQVQYYNGVEYYYANPQQCNYYYYPQNPFTDMTYGGPPAMPPPQQGAPAPPPPVTYNNNNNHNNNNNNNNNHHDSTILTVNLLIEERQRRRYQHGKTATTNHHHNHNNNNNARPLPTFAAPPPVIAEEKTKKAQGEPEKTHYHEKKEEEGASPSNNNKEKEEDATGLLTFSPKEERALRRARYATVDYTDLNLKDISPPIDNNNNETNYNTPTTSNNIYSLLEGKDGPIHIRRDLEAKLYYVHLQLRVRPLLVLEKQRLRREIRKRQKREEEEQQQTVSRTDEESDHTNTNSNNNNNENENNHHHNVPTDGHSSRSQTEDNEPPKIHNRKEKGKKSALETLLTTYEELRETLHTRTTMNIAFRPRIKPIPTEHNIHHPIQNYIPNNNNNIRMERGGRSQRGGRGRGGGYHHHDHLHYYRNNNNNTPPLSPYPRPFGVHHDLQPTGRQYFTGPPPPGYSY